MEIPDKVYKSVVAIGFYMDDKNSENTPLKRQLLGTGVLIKDRHYIVITAEHVILDENKQVRQDLIFWGNGTDGKPFERPFIGVNPEWKNIKWVRYSQADLAATIVGIAPNDDVAFVTLDQFQGITDLKKGDDVFYLGFPAKLGSEFGSDPMLRKGMIGLKKHDNKFFYIDATVAGGNSGGPVFKETTGGVKLIGIVSAFVPFMFGDKNMYHTGIGVVYPVDYIKELLRSPEFEATR